MWLSAIHVHKFIKRGGGLCQSPSTKNKKRKDQKIYLSAFCLHRHLFQTYDDFFIDHACKFTYLGRHVPASFNVLFVDLCLCREGTCPVLAACQFFFFFNSLGVYLSSPRLSLVVGGWQQLPHGKLCVHFGGRSPRGTTDTPDSLIFPYQIIYINHIYKIYFMERR